MFEKKEIEKLEKFLFQQSLSIIRHDLNNYLTVTLNYSNFIKEDKIKDKLKDSVKKTISYLKEGAEEKYNLREKYNQPIDSKNLISGLKNKLKENKFSFDINEKYSKRKINIRYKYFHLIIIRFLMDYLLSCNKLSMNVSEKNDFLVINFIFDSCNDYNDDSLTLDIIERYFDKKSVLVNSSNITNIEIKIPYLKKNSGD